MAAKGSAVLERKSFQSGTVIFREGEHGSSAYLIQEGIVEILVNFGTPEQKSIGEINKGGLFGEMALIDDKPRMATARAKTAVTVILASRMMFSRKLEATDPFIRGMVRVLSNHIRAMAKDGK